MIKVVCVFGKRGVGKTTYLKEEVIIPSSLPCVIIDTLNEFEEYARLISLETPVRRLKFKSRFLIDSDAEFQFICRLLSFERKRPINFIVSEVDFWTSTQYLPKHFANLLRYSRHYKVNIYCDVRNPIELNRKISALADRFIIFKITEPRYLDYFKLYNPNLPNWIANIVPMRYGKPLIKGVHYIEYIL